jgi:hypothetical protein
MSRELTNDVLHNTKNDIVIHTESHGGHGEVVVRKLQETDVSRSVYSIENYGTSGKFHCSVLPFQQGPIPEVGVNGFTNESLLAILIHRTKILNHHVPSLQNQMALEHLEQTKLLFEDRTKDRKTRGVEGSKVA